MGTATLFSKTLRESAAMKMGRHTRNTPAKRRCPSCLLKRVTVPIFPNEADEVCDEANETYNEAM